MSFPPKTYFAANLGPQTMVREAGPAGRLRSAVATPRPEFDPASGSERCTMNRMVIGSSEKKAGTAIRTAGRRRCSPMDRMRGRRGDGESGQTLVEFSMVAPVLLLLTFGMCLFGIAFNKYLTLNNAVEVGGQLLSEERGSGVADPCAAASTATENAAPNIPLTNTSFSYNIAGTSYPNTNSCSGVTLSEGSNVTETASYQLTFYVPFMGNQSYTLNSSVEEIVQ
jgi:Flp pilus assembly protein TadG